MRGNMLTCKREYPCKDTQAIGNSSGLWAECPEYSAALYSLWYSLNFFRTTLTVYSKIKIFNYKNCHFLIGNILIRLRYFRNHLKLFSGKSCFVSPFQPIPTTLSPSLHMHIHTCTEENIFHGFFCVLPEFLYANINKFKCIF